MGAFLWRSCRVRAEELDGVRRWSCCAPSGLSLVDGWRVGSAAGLFCTLGPRRPRKATARAERGRDPVRRGLGSPCPPRPGTRQSSQAGRKTTARSRPAVPAAERRGAPRALRLTAAPPPPPQAKPAKVNLARAAAAVVTSVVSVCRRRACAMQTAVPCSRGTAPVRGLCEYARAHSAPTCLPTSRAAGPPGRARYRCRGQR